MKALSKLLACLLVCSMLFSLSCRDEIIQEKDSQKETPKVKLSNTEIKKAFGAALAKVLKDSPAVRKLIKDEALKQIDFDYDVLYLLVKDEILSDNTTLEEQLLKYLDPELLTSVETQIPNLTVFVPKLPENSFSAELWDVNNETPCVGIRTRETNDIPAFDSEGDEYLIKVQYIPAYPIVVIKENERVVLGGKSTKSGITLGFLDDVFNHLKGEEFKSDRFPETYLFTEEQLAKTEEAYEIYKNKDGWQRDYIYYNIRQESPNGPFHTDISEYVIGFEMTGNPLYAYNKIADQTGDPVLNSSKGFKYGEGSGWTDGEFEFVLKLYVGSHTAVGDVIKKYLRIAPQDLFDFGISSKSGRNLMYYTLDGITAKKAQVLLPLFEWNLEDYSSSIKIEVEEVDGTETEVHLTEYTSEFAGNFGFDLGFGEKVKKGLKFGASDKITHKTSYQVTTTKGNDVLGEAVINFADEVITDKYLETYPPTPTQRQGYTVMKRVFNSKYDTGWCRLYIAPLKNN